MRSLLFPKSQVCCSQFFWSPFLIYHQLTWLFYSHLKATFLKLDWIVSQTKLPFLASLFLSFPFMSSRACLCHRKLRLSPHEILILCSLTSGRHAITATAIFQNSCALLVHVTSLLKNQVRGLLEKELLWFFINSKWTWYILCQEARRCSRNDKDISKGRGINLTGCSHWPYLDQISIWKNNNSYEL